MSLETSAPCLWRDRVANTGYQDRQPPVSGSPRPATAVGYGGAAVVNHHPQVPFRLLKDVPDLACGDPGLMRRSAGAGGFAGTGRAGGFLR